MIPVDRVECPRKYLGLVIHQRHLFGEGNQLDPVVPPSRRMLLPYALIDSDYTTSDHAAKQCAGYTTYGLILNEIDFLRDIPSKPYAFLFFPELRRDGREGIIRLFSGKSLQVIVIPTFQKEQLLELRGENS